jgi:hypothetical protein
MFEEYKDVVQAQMGYEDKPESCEVLALASQQHNTGERQLAAPQFAPNPHLPHPCST